MKCCIRRKDTGEFLHMACEKASWSTLDEAHKFDNEVKAKNFITHNFSSWVHPSIPKDQVDIIPYQKALSGGPPEEEITEEQATEYMENLPNLISGLRDIGQSVSALQRYYNGQLFDADMALEDLLHKIEFTNVGVVEGYKLYKAVQEMRLRRRECKDICTALNLVNNSGVLRSLDCLKSGLSKLESNMENRKYTPRILDELFQTSTSTN